MDICTGVEPSVLRRRTAGVFPCCLEGGVVSYGRAGIRVQNFPCFRGSEGLVEDTDSAEAEEGAHRVSPGSWSG